MTTHRDRIELEAPLSGDFQAVVRLIIGGIAERVDFAFEEIDDLQLAVERLLAEAGTAGTVSLTFEVGDNRIRTRIGPLSELKVAEALRDGDFIPGQLTLRRILETVVDSFGVDRTDGGEIVVRLEDVRLYRPAEAVEQVRLRYHARPLACRARPSAGGAIELELAEPAEVAAPGQLACLMRDDCVVGEGTIA